jgi:fatty acid-binding protein DegV
MAKIGLIVDSTFTISEELAKKHDISIIPLTVWTTTFRRNNHYQTT